MSSRGATTVTVDPNRCYDWFIVRGHCSYARDRSSFTTYREVRATVMGLEVLGIGSVQLQLINAPESPTPRIQMITIRPVLHIPSVLCNGINLFHVTPLPALSQSGDRLVDFRGESLGYMERFRGGMRVVLTGNPNGISPIKEGVALPLNLDVYLSGDETARMLRLCYDA
ncbi:hypothetical protein B0J14DRAFT_61483 [Halenospora varia]|nr:hypothetical protein B0J14DRAFT_61483 [Halenospora varia]